MNQQRVDQYFIQMMIPHHQMAMMMADLESAKLFSDYLGLKEVKLKQKSRGRSSGKASTNIAEQVQTKPLFEASDFLQLPTGRCILLNPHFLRGKVAYIPLLE